MNISVKKFHRERIAFAIINDKIYFLKNSEMSHKEWLVDSGILSEVFFRKIIRGYVLNNEIYFYKNDFDFNLEDKNESLKYLSEICRYCFLVGEIKLNFGVQKGKIGEQWKPKISEYRTI